MSNRMWLRAVKWARNPPSEKQVIRVLAIVGICVGIYLIERYVGWPDWMTLDRVSRKIR